MNRDFVSMFLIFVLFLSFSLSVPLDLFLSSCLTFFLPIFAVFCLCPYQMFIVQRHWWKLSVLFLHLPIFKTWEFHDHVKLLKLTTLQCLCLWLRLSLNRKSAFCHWKASLLLEDFKHLPVVLMLHLLLKARQVQSLFLVFASSNSVVFLAVGI